jgi:hypothetical protein
MGKDRRAYLFATRAPAMKTMHRHGLEQDECRNRVILSRERALSVERE